MSFDLLHIWAHMGLGSRLIAGVLGLMALLTLTLTAERLSFLAVSASASRKFAPRASELVDRRDFAYPFTRRTGSAWGLPVELGRKLQGGSRGSTFAGGEANGSRS